MTNTASKVKKQKILSTAGTYMHEQVKAKVQLKINNNKSTKTSPQISTFEKLIFMIALPFKSLFLFCFQLHENLTYIIINTYM